MKSLQELMAERERLVKPENVKTMTKLERRNETMRLRLLDKGIQFLACNPSEDFAKRQLGQLEKKIEAIKKLANERVKIHQAKNHSAAQRIRASVYKEQNIRKLWAQKNYVEFILN